MIQRLRLPIGFLVLSAACQAQPVLEAPAPRSAAGELLPPTLVVMLTIDQYRADYEERFGAQYTGGLARLYREGAVYTDAHQDHATTETAPGHASVLSGRFPRSTGIASNSAGVADTSVRLIGYGGAGASPWRFQGTALFDWLSARNPRSRALSVSMKDRGAILPVGRARQEVYWYHIAGRFTTSTYYRDDLPAWVQRVNARRVPQRAAGQSWTLLLAESEYPEPDSVPHENRGRNFTFPHVLPEDTLQAANVLRGTPWMDELTLALALEGVVEMGLGAGPHPDLLAISLSATDIVGHTWGPDSREVRDQVLRLDRMLGDFLDSLFKLRDPARVAIAVTADHGVAPYRALAPTRSDDEALGVNVDPVLAEARERMQVAGVSPLALRRDGGVLYLDREAFAGRPLRPDSVLAMLASRLAATRGVLRVDDVRTLAAKARAGDRIARRWHHMVQPGSGAELVVTLTRFSLWSTIDYATHGSPHDYDSHVPIIFHGPWFAPGRHDGPVRTVDIGPTLAHVANVAPTQELDGRVLTRSLRQGPVLGGESGTMQRR